MKEDKEDFTKLKSLINSGTEIAGGAIGGALGFLAGGPLGAAALGAGGITISKILCHLGNDISERVLSPREKTRIGGVLALTSAQINDRLNKGQKLRPDFTIGTNGKRNEADEIIESVLLKCQKEPEERKLPFISNLLTNITFQPDIDSGLAHLLIRMAERLSYRQYCLLSIIPGKYNLLLHEGDYRNHGSFSKELYSILYDFLELYSLGMVNFGGSVAFGPTDISPSKSVLQGIGADLYNYLELWNVQEADRQIVISALK